MAEDMAAAGAYWHHPWMSGILPALVNLFGLIILGFVLYRAGGIAPTFWAGAERLTYFVLLPSLLIARLAGADLGDLRLLPLVTTLASAVAIVALLSYLIRPRSQGSGPGYTSAFQGSVRINVYIGIGMASALLGAQGVVYAALVLALLVPLVNVLCVWNLLSFGTHAGRKPHLAVMLAQNPLVLACLIGMALNLSGLGLWQQANDFLSLLGQAALPLSLLVVGAGLRPGLLWHGRGAIVSASVLKLALFPAITALIAYLLQLEPALATVAVLITAAPASASSYILARQLGGDAELMAGILTAQTLLAMFTLPLAIHLLLGW